ncbi:MAG: histidinol dehydrogenase [Nitrospirae bacterium]|nr:histidinol dehydrogenase [Nitrospirota bacterium]
MKILKHPNETREFLSLLRKRASGGTREVEAAVKKILSDVREKGDEAVLRYTEKFDSLKVKDIRVPHAEITKHANKADRKIVRALEKAAKRIRSFHEMQREGSWAVTEPGYEECDAGKFRETAAGRQRRRTSLHALLGQIVRPLERVGVYVPGGKASYPSTALMNVIPAQVAGVEEIVLCVPTPNNEVNPYVMAAVKMLGLREVYRIGGAQAVGAMAYGTRSLKKVDKIVGPGNIYVATAKRLVFGEVGIDMIAGPSEVLIIADKAAAPAFIAADLLSQAEHDELASSILITNSRTLAEKVLAELKSRLAQLKRKAIAERSLQNYGALLLTRDIRAAVRLANEIAPEHLELMTGNPFELLPGIRNAGAIFVGPWTPEPLGDYVAGPNHTLPTGGTARFSSPLGVYDFVKRSSLLSFSEEGFRRLAKTVITLSEIEGLTAHGNTMRVRLHKR